MKIIILLLIFPLLLIAQNTKITILDKLDNKPLNGIQFFSENGSFIGNSNTKGEFEFDLKLFLQSGFKNMMIYNSDYLPIEYKIDKIPSIIYLEKTKVYQLKRILLVQKLSKKYFTLNGFVRSWQLVNNKLVKYGDAILEYHLPYDSVKNNVNTGIKYYYKGYRTFKVDSIKSKSKIISFSAFDTYLNAYITKNDKLSVYKKLYKTLQLKDNSGVIYDEDSKVGYVLYNKNHNPIEISITRNFEKNDAIKVLLWKISGKDKDIEKWTEEGELRHPSYVFTSRKRFVKTKVEGEFNNVETITEIFIDDEIIYNDKKPKKYKRHIDKESSFYGSPYWEELLLKNPLPSEIKSQLINVNENRNKY